MFRKVLVPVDLTDRHGRVLDLAARLASGGGEVVVLHVIEMVQGLTREEDPAFYQRLEAKAIGQVAQLADALRAKKVTARGEVLYGDRVGEILDFASRDGTDLIALASHPVDRSPPGGGWVTLSYQVGLLATCPVLLVK